MPTASEVALAAFCSRLEGKERNYITSISMKYLLLRCVGRRADSVRVDSGCEILDVSEDHIGGFAIKAFILATAFGRDMGCKAGVDDDVFFACVVLDGNAADDFEAVAEVDLLGDAAKRVVKLGKRECFLCDVTERLVEAFFYVSIHVQYYFLSRKTYS